MNKCTMNTTTTNFSKQINANGICDASMIGLAFMGHGCLLYFLQVEVKILVSVQRCLMLMVLFMTDTLHVGCYETPGSQI